MKYVIEKMVGNARNWFRGWGEWSTTEIWSDVDTDAVWYDTREEAEEVSSEIGGEVTGFED